MEALTALLNLIGKLFIPISAYFAGKKSADNKNLKAENKKLKEYKKVDDREIQTSEVYDEKNWN